MKRREEANETHEWKDEAAVEVVVEGEKPAVVDYVGQVALQVDGVEGSHGAGANTKQSASQREIHFSIHTGNVTSSEPWLRCCTQQRL